MGILQYTRDVFITIMDVYEMASASSSNGAKSARYRFPNCQQYRDEAGLTKEELKTKGKCSRSTLSSIEKGEVHSIAKIRAVFNALNKELGNRLRFEQEVFDG